MKEYVNTFLHYRFLLGELVKKGIKLKYRRSYLGIVWSLLEPLLTMIVLTIVFGTLFGNKDRTFHVYILTGRLLYSYFSNSTSRALKSVRANAGMIKKVYVPKYIYPLSSVLYNYVIFLISLIVLAIVSVVLGIQPTIYMFQIPIALILVLLLSYGIGMILATIGVFFRVVISTDDHYVYLCNFLFSVQTFEEWFCMDTEIQSIVLHNQYFSFCHVWRNDEYPLFCICAGL